MIVRGVARQPAAAGAVVRASYLYVYARTYGTRVNPLADFTAIATATSVAARSSLSATLLVHALHVRDERDRV